MVVVVVGDKERSISNGTFGFVPATTTGVTFSFSSLWSSPKRSPSPPSSSSSSESFSKGRFPRSNASRASLAFCKEGARTLAFMLLWFELDSSSTNSVDEEEDEEESSSRTTEG